MSTYRIETIIPDITNLAVTYVGHCACGYSTGIYGDRKMAEAHIARCIHPAQFF